MNKVRYLARIYVERKLHFDFVQECNEVKLVHLTFIIYSRSDVESESYVEIEMYIMFKI